MFVPGAVPLGVSQNLCQCQCKLIQNLL